MAKQMETERHQATMREWHAVLHAARRGTLSDVAGVAVVGWETANIVPTADAAACSCAPTLSGTPYTVASYGGGLRVAWTQGLQ